MLSRPRRSRAQDELVKTRAQIARLRGQRELLKLQLDAMTATEHGVVAELHRLRELGFGRPDREQALPRYLFVLSVGRTGSTLVQGVLNSVPGVLIRGENGGFVVDLFNLHSKALHHRDRLSLDKSLLRRTNAWWGIDGYPEDVALREFRQLTTDLVLRPEPGVHTVGFKEIAWGEDEIADVLTFTRAVFPGARFVFSSRRLEDVATSGFWADRPDAMPRLVALDATIRATLEQLGDDGFEVKYEDVADDVDGFRPLFNWLGFEFQRQVVSAVASQQHSYAPRRGRTGR